MSNHQIQNDMDFDKIHTKSLKEYYRPYQRMPNPLCTVTKGYSYGHSHKQEFENILNNNQAIRISEQNIYLCIAFT